MLILGKSLTRCQRVAPLFAFFLTTIMLCTPGWIEWSIASDRLRLILSRHAFLNRLVVGGYPPDKRAGATDLVLEQAEVLCAGWASDS